MPLIHAMLRTARIVAKALFRRALPRRCPVAGDARKRDAAAAARRGVLLAALLTPSVLFAQDAGADAAPDAAAVDAAAAPAPALAPEPKTPTFDLRREFAAADRIVAAGPERFRLGAPEAPDTGPLVHVLSPRIPAKGQVVIVGPPGKALGENPLERTLLDLLPDAGWDLYLVQAPLPLPGARVDAAMRRASDERLTARAGAALAAIDSGDKPSFVVSCAAPPKAVLGALTAIGAGASDKLELAGLVFLDSLSPSLLLAPAAPVPEAALAAEPAAPEPPVPAELGDAAAEAPAAEADAAATAAPAVPPANADPAAEIAQRLQHDALTSQQKQREEQRAAVTALGDDLNELAVPVLVGSTGIAPGEAALMLKRQLQGAGRSYRLEHVVRGQSAGLPAAEAMAQRVAGFLDATINPEPRSAFRRARP